VVDELNFTALSHAALIGNSEIVRLLINYGADANITSDVGCNSNLLNSPLSFAIKNNNRENIRILLPKTNLHNIENAIFRSINNNNDGIETLIEIAQGSDLVWRRFSP
jgi:ankyrin repeat protein